MSEEITVLRPNSLGGLGLPHLSSGASEGWEGTVTESKPPAQECVICRYSAIGRAGVATSAASRRCLAKCIGQLLLTAAAPGVRNQCPARHLVQYKYIVQRASERYFLPMRSPSNSVWTAPSRRHRMPVMLPRVHYHNCDTPTGHSNPNPVANI